MRNNAIFNSYFSSFRMASFRYFVFSPGVISSFRYFAWRFFVISSFRLALFRLFAPPERQAKRRKNAMRKDEITKRRHAKRRNNATRNNKITPCEKTKRRPKRNLTRLPKMHSWFLVCCIIGNVNVKVKYVDLDRAALVWAVWATREV